MTTRRTFLFKIVPAVGATAVFGTRFAAAAPLVKETDAMAVALGYKADTAKVDAKKYPKHQASQTCANCALYTGKAGAATGPCSLFAGKEVAKNGWCMSWAKKA